MTAKFSYTMKPGISRVGELYFRKYDPGTVIGIIRDGKYQLVFIGRDEVMFITPDGKLTWSSIKHSTARCTIREIKEVNIVVE